MLPPVVVLIAFPAPFLIDLALCPPVNPKFYFSFPAENGPGLLTFRPGR